jgi:Periplasmic binding protein
MGNDSISRASRHGVVTLPCSALVRTGADSSSSPGQCLRSRGGEGRQRDHHGQRGQVLGHVLFPLNTPDFSSFLLHAQGSKAKTVALNGGGQDAINSIKQAREFGIVAGGQRLAAPLLTVAEIHGLGLEAAQGLVLTESYYWDLNDRNREFGERCSKRTGRMPNMIQAFTQRPCNISRR